MRLRLLLASLLWLALFAGCEHEVLQAPVPAPAPPPPPEPWPAIDEAFLEASAATLGFRLGKPQPLAIAPDGTLFFRRTGPRDKRADLYALAPNGESAIVVTAEQLLEGGREVLSADERARRERTRTATAGIVDMDLSADGERLLIPLGQRVFVFDRATKASRELPIGEGYPYDPRLSPDGRTVSFVRDGDLWSIDVASGKLRRLTRHPPELDYATAEFVAQEEFERTRGYWWSPDSQWLAFQRTDPRPVGTIYVSDARHPERDPEPFAYPRAGTPNAIVDLGLVPAGGGEPRFIRWDLERWPYLARVAWPKNGPLHLIVFNRAQTELALLRVDVKTGALRELLSERDPAWVNLPAGAPAWLPNGTGFVWMREAQEGYALDLFDAFGNERGRVLAPTFGLRSVVGVEQDNQAVIVLGASDPREQHVWRVPLDGGAPQSLTANGGVHSAIAEHGVVAISSSLREGGSRTSALYPDDRSQELPSVAERPALVANTQLGTFDVPGARLYSAITRPRNLRPGARYPVLLKVYAGPGVQTVLDARDSYVLDQWVADAGFVVIRADGRGTPNRGRDFERAISGDVIKLPLDDQVAAIEALQKQYPELDATRAGVFGWSFGGYASTMAVLLRPDVFKAAVAGAPVTDWSLYDTAYTERYMRTPAENAAGYERTSALTHAASLSRPLLLIHGITDDNVHFANTLALIESLYAAGKSVQVVALSSTHMVADPKLTVAREKIQIDFFRAQLGKP